MRNSLGKLRRSQVVATYGPGSIVDFRAGGHGGAAISVLAAGLDDWDTSAKPAGLLNAQRISEPRLEKKLGVRGFRLPPVALDKEEFPPVLSGIRFPSWLLCPRCTELKPAINWSGDPGDPALYCASCTSIMGQRIHVVPVRFIIACEHGHLDEFPWHHWLSHKPACNRRGTLKLVGEGAGLKGLVLKCSSCGQGKTMDGAFSKVAMKRLGVKCAGKRPWLPGAAETCACPTPPVAVQRGASNLYFPAVESAIDIPPWSDDFQESIGDQWHNLMSANSPEDRDKVVELVIWPNWEGQDMTLDQLKAKVRQRIELSNNVDKTDLRFEEYLQLTSGQSPKDDRREFSLRPEKIPFCLGSLLGHVARVVRLREVRAIYGFTRIHPPSGPAGPELAKLSVGKKTWLPAVEVRGEGIFTALDETSLRAWESRSEVAIRVDVIRARYLEEWQSRMGEDLAAPLMITPRFVLMHTLSHALMRQLSLECGYSTSSLRERLYVDENSPGMCGVLIYTSTADADGTLGGLARQGRSVRFGDLMKSSLKAVEWCSNDPLCMKGINAFSEGMNLAACHSCVHAPETACEQFNRFLDRALLIGVPGNPELGFFSKLLGEV